MRTIAGGEHDVEVDTRGRDEVTEMAHAVAVFLDNAIEMERMRGDPVAAERRASEERPRSEESRVGKGYVSTCRSRWSTYPLQQQLHLHQRTIIIRQDRP